MCSVSTKEVGMSSSLSSAGYLYSLKHLYPKLKSFICIKKIIDKYVWGLSQLSSGMNEEMPGFDSKMTIIMTGLGALRYAMELVHMEIHSSPDKSPLL